MLSNVQAVKLEWRQLPGPNAPCPAAFLFNIIFLTVSLFHSRYAAAATTAATTAAATVPARG